MANVKISAMASGAPALVTDEFPIARAGAPYKLTLADVTGIGAPIYNGTATRVLFVDGSGNLGQDAGLTYNASTDTLTVVAAVISGAGSASAPGFAFSGATSYGFGVAAGALFTSINGTETQRIYGGGEYRYLSTAKHGWTSGATDAAQDTVLSRYAAKQLMISGDGTGATTNAGWIFGYSGVSGVSAIYNSGVTPSSFNNSVLYASTTATILNAPSGGSIDFAINAASKAAIVSTAGSGLAITAGTAADNVPRALSISQTWTDGTSSNIGVVVNITEGTATGKLLSLQSGASGTTEVFSVDQAGVATAENYINSPTGFYVGTRLLLASGVADIIRGGSGEVFGFSSNANINLAASDTAISRISAGVLGIGTGAAGSTAGTVQAAIFQATTNNSFKAPVGGYFFWDGRSGISSSADGLIKIANAADTDFGRLQFGGTTSSFPALKRSSATLQARLADDSAYATFDGKFAASGAAGANFGPGVVTSITVVDGIVTAIS